MAFIESEWSTPVNFTVRAEDPIDTQMVKLLPEGVDPTANFFGYAISMSSNGLSAAVSAPWDDEIASAAGKVLIYTRTGDLWSLQATLVATDGGVSDNFGISVSLSGDGLTVLIGAYADDVGANSNQGSAYVFTRSGSVWTQQAKLLASDGAAVDHFGYSVALNSDGNTAIVGAYMDDSPDSNAGSAYVFTRSGVTWTQQQKFTASEVASDNKFGSSVSLSSDGNKALIGCPGFNGNQGVAFIFTRTGVTWAQQIRLEASDKAGNDNFGYSVAMSNDGLTAICGSYRDTNAKGSYAGSAYVFTYNGGTWTQQAKLLASDGAANDEFGISVSLSSNGSTALIGASGDDDIQNTSGSAYVYTRSGSTWTQQAKIRAATPVVNEKLGKVVCLSSDGIYALVGAPDSPVNATEAGAFYFFKYTTSWSLSARYLQTNTTPGDLFGQSVSLSSDGLTALVSSVGGEQPDSGIVHPVGYMPPGKNDDSEVYVFTRSGFSWTKQARLIASDSSKGNGFGESLSLSDDGNTAVIGASNDGSYKGSAYVFTRVGSTWTQQAKLLASDGAANNYFGHAVSLSSDGNTAAIGAAANSSGSAYIFTRSGGVWTQQVKLVASDATVSDSFGESISLSADGNTVLIGSNNDDDLGSSSGSAYVFTRSGVTWTQQAKLLASDGALSDWFGKSVSLSADGNTALIGAYGCNTTVADTGAAYIFTRAGSTWTQRTKLLASDKATGDYFGISVSLSDAGSRAVIGAYSANADKGATYTFVGSGASWFQQSKLVASDGQVNDAFGISVAISGDSTYVLVGASSDDDKGTSSGSAYGFSTGFFAEKAKLLASDGVTNDDFGFSVSLSSDGVTAIIGTPSDDSSKGSAYVFTRNGNVWTQQAKLTASDGDINDEFGSSVSLSSDGNTALIGMHYDHDSNYSTVGSAYIFIRNGTTWSQQAKLVASDSAAGDMFGQSVSLSSDGSMAIIGCPGDDTSKGSAYVYTRSGSTWTQQAKLIASDLSLYDNFGWSVSLSTDNSTAVISATGDDDLGAASGCVYIFTRTGVTWTQQVKLTASDGVAGDEFGKAVSLSSDSSTLLISSPYKANGSVYVFTRNGNVWTQQAKLLASDGAANDSFGHSVSLSSDGSTALIGATGNASNRGSTYTFTRSGSVWTQQAKLTASDGDINDEFGVSVSLSADGSTALIGSYGDNSDRGSAYVFQP